VEKNQKPICVVATQIVQKAISPDVSVHELAQLATMDPGFAARVVALANSATYGVRNRVSDIRQACMLLGVRGLRNVALGLVVSDMVPTGPDGNVLLVNSLRRAAAARLIAEALGDRALDDAFTAGLFLEIGTLLRARSDLAGAANVARMPAAYRSVFERSFGSGDHAHAGARFVMGMSLPEAMSDAVARHHEPSPPSAHLARIAWAAERVAGAWEGGDLDRLRDEATKALAEVGVKGEAGVELMRRLPEIVTAAAVTFMRPIEEQVALEQLKIDANARLVEMNVGYEQLVLRLEAIALEKDALAEKLRLANVDLANLALTDALTGLPNRRAFADAMTREIARAQRSNTALSLMMLDVDHFKRLNDTHGHQAGDVVLAKVAAVLRSCLRIGDTPARYGGEEFVVMLPDAGPEGAAIVAERVRAALEATQVAGPQGIVLKATASFGVASLQAGGGKDLAADLLRRADAAMYQAKSMGRNRVVVIR